MAKNPKNNDIIGVLVLICIITAVVTVIVMKMGYDFKYAIIAGVLFTLYAVAPKPKRFLYKVSYMVNGQTVIENIRADSEYEAQNLIYSKYPGQVIENITIITLSGK